MGGAVLLALETVYYVGDSRFPGPSWDKAFTYDVYRQRGVQICAERNEGTVKPKTASGQE